VKQLLHNNKADGTGNPIGSAVGRIRLRALGLLHELLSFFLFFSVMFLSPSQLLAQDAAKTTALPESGLVLRNAPDPLRFFDVTGRKAAVFGRQTGQFEAWIYPIKLLHNFRLEFQQEGMLEPLRGETLLRQIITRPESTTLVYVHPNFTVREIIWTPLDNPAIVIYFDVDSRKALDITAGFVPDFKPMWPASLGGQHSEWIPEENAFALTDGSEHPTALAGSPQISGHSDFTDHQLGAGEMLMRFRFQPEGHASELQPLVMTLSMESQAKARELFAEVLRRSPQLFDERVRYHRRFLDTTLSLETPDPEINHDFTWAKIALDSGWVCNATYGCGLVAGYGPSFAGERPGFDWWFGGDALMASWALEDYGDLDGAIKALRFLKNTQRSDGKIMHELSQSAELIDWFGKYGYAYYHADTTPMYLFSLDRYWRRTGDRSFLEEFWPSAKNAYAYCVSTLSSEDGLMDNTKAGLAAVEVGVLRGKVVKDVYLEGFWLSAAESMQNLAGAMQDSRLVQDSRVRANKAHESIRRDWWDPERKTFAFGLSADGHRAELTGAWPAVALALSSGLDPGQSKFAAKTIAAPNLSTDWGVRWLSSDSPLYDPLSYNNGTAWPFVSGMASWAEYQRRFPLAGFQLWSGLTNLTSLSSPGMLPELMNGDRFLPGEFAVPHQLFSSAGIVLPAVRGLLGLETNFSETETDSAAEISFSPKLPADWPFVRFEHYAISNGQLSGEIRQEPGRTTIKLEHDAKIPLNFMIGPAIPALARVKTVRANGIIQKYSVQPFGSFLQVQVTPINLKPGQKLTLTIEYDGGIAIVPPRPHPEPGERSSLLRVLDVETPRGDPQCSLKVELAGVSGKQYLLSIISSWPHLHSEGLPVRKTRDGFEITVSFDGTGYATRQACLSE
jgi:hypothetical protein